MAMKNLFEQKAEKYIHTADHILTQTYPLVDNPKILLGVIDNLHKAIMNIISMILSHERAHRRIPPFHDNEESKINAFKNHITDRYQINIEYITLIEETRDILERHKKSPVEFSRKNKFFICTDDYKLRMISVEEMKKYISKTKIFLMEINKIVNKYV